ncbi:helix-turn-helix transcriptional regulator [Saccharopolyspora gregorii]|uniref:helix-turn-helix transcriptional regulator n=1 Tax=Saccharopolyspora gregorii TaxID=33914 RepID=UPI0021AC755B|nr:helix-turn-helix domain-containing protein [Saccharopolyspora gregorii]
MGDDSDEHLLREAGRIATALGRMFPGLCEVVLHDLRDPSHPARVVENGSPGREVGGPAAELARLSDPGQPGVLQNRPSRFPDGRPAKSTSIGIENAAGRRIAALRVDLDVSVLSPVALALSNLVATDAGESPEPQAHARDRDALRRTVERAAAERAATPRALPREAKRELVRRLRADGHFASHDAARTIADLLGVSRATVYNYAR